VDYMSVKNILIQFWRYKTFGVTNRHKKHLFFFKIKTTFQCILYFLIWVIFKINFNNKESGKYTKGKNYSIQKFWTMGLDYNLESAVNYLGAFSTR